MSNIPRILVVAAIFSFLVGSAVAQDWPQWRGPNRDNKVAGFTEPKTWPKTLTKKWSVTVGKGEASPVMVGDRVYTFGRIGEDEVALCLDAATGKELWRDKYPSDKITNAAKGYPGPRSTPALGEGKVCTLGVHGVVSCYDAKTGKLVWRKETGQKPQYFTSSSPIVTDGKCIVFVGALTAYDLANGDAKWKWTGAGTPYGSPVLMKVGDKQTIVTPAMGALAGVSMEGKDLWQVKIGSGFDYQSNYSTPMVDGNMVYYSVTGGGKKGGGSMIALKIEESNGKFTATEVWKKNTPAAGYHSPTYRDGLIFGVNGSRYLFCLDAKTGDEKWKDNTQRGQCGAILNAGSVMISSSSENNLIAFRPTDKGYQEVAKYSLPGGEMWCVPIVAGNRIYVKDKNGSLTLWTLE